MSRRASSPIGPRYSPPRDVVEIDSSTVGFTNGFFLKVPRLYMAGDDELLGRPSVAIVGSREASIEGKQRAAQLARTLVREGIVVMSGLAAGIDEAAHRAAIESGGSTIAVVGTPLDKVYPREHAAMQQLIYEQHLLISPFPLGMRTFPSHFPERNRVMARLAQATVIIEAGDTSGSLHQAVASLEVGHPVFISNLLVENSKLTWPARFMGKPNVHVLTDSTDVGDVLLR